MTDARKLLLTRGIRGLADGLVSVALASYLTGLGFGAFEVGGPPVFNPPRPAAGP